MTNNQGERPWQQPLSEEAKADLARQFAILKRLYDELYGPPTTLPRFR